MIINKKSYHLNIILRCIVNKWEKESDNDSGIEVIITESFFKDFVYEEHMDSIDNYVTEYDLKEFFDFEPGFYEVLCDVHYKSWINPSGSWGPEEGDSSLDISNIRKKSISELMFDELIQEENHMPNVETITDGITVTVINKEEIWKSKKPLLDHLKKQAEEKSKQKPEA